LKTGAALHRRGDEYSLDELDDLEEEANDAKIEQVYKGIDYLVKVLEDKSIDYGLMGGIAMQLFGMKGRETHDGDMAISVNSAELLDAVQDDPKYAVHPIICYGQDEVDSSHLVFDDRAD
jgi:hypothetical protein